MLDSEGPIPASLFSFVLFTLQFKYKLKIAKLIYLALETGTPGWYAQTDPLSLFVSDGQPFNDVTR